MDKDKTYLAIPLQTNIDTQLGPDGHPWIRIQFANPGISTSVVFPVENGEEVIANITEGIRQQMRQVGRREIETIIPDFTGMGLTN